MIVAEELAHPGVFQVLEPIGKAVDHFLRDDMGIKLDRMETIAHPQEDYLLASEKFPIFVVADGVTLEFGTDGTYPNPSGAGKLARIFCEAIIREAEARFFAFTENDVAEIFSVANKAVGEYNTEEGRTKEASNFWDFDLFAATAAFAVVKGDVVYWASLCDAYMVRLGVAGEIVFQSPVCWPQTRKETYLPKDWGSVPEDEKKKTIRRIYRNGLDEQGEPNGYGVTTGETAACRYLNIGTFELKEGEKLLLISDGFEEYIKLPEFRALFREYSDDLQERVSAFTTQKAKEDGVKYGHERSVIAYFQ